MSVCLTATPYAFYLSSSSDPSKELNHWRDLLDFRTQTGRQGFDGLSAEAVVGRWQTVRRLLWNVVECAGYRTADALQLRNVYLGHALSLPGVRVFR